LFLLNQAVISKKEISADNQDEDEFAANKSKIVLFAK